MLVRSKETGKTIDIKESRFNSEYHEHIENKKVSKKTLKGVECPECGKVCKGNLGLSSHIRNNHPEIYEDWKSSL